MADKTLERLEGLLAVARLVSDGVRGDSLLEAVADTVSRSFGFRTVAVNLYRPAEDDFLVSTVCGGEEARAALLGTTSTQANWETLLDPRFGQAGAFFVPSGAIDWRERDQVTFVPDIDPLQDPHAWHPDDALLVPMRRADGRMLGILSVDEPVSGLRPTRGEMAVLAGVAAHLAQALEWAEASHANELLVEQLRDAERRYRSLVEQLPAAVYRAEFGARARWLYVSPQIEWLLGFAPEEWLADPKLWFAQLHPDDRADALAHEERSKVTREPFSCTYRMRTRDGREVWIRDEAVVVAQAGGVVLQGALSDVTIEKQAEEALAAASMAKTEFLAGVSHELRNPLVAIIGWMQLMRERPQLTDTSEVIEIVLGAAQQLENLISGLLDVTAAESGRLTIEPAPTDPRMLLEEASAALSAAAEIRKIALLREADGAPARVMLDPARVRQVLYNFVSNALKHAPAGSAVTLRATADRGGVRFEVSDAGRGIAAEDQAKLFKPYVRLAGAPAGTGLGLAVARRIVEAHGGEIGVRSAPGAGATFWIRLPRAPATAAQSAPAQRGSAVKSASS